MKTKLFVFFSTLKGFRIQKAKRTRKYSISGIQVGDDEIFILIFRVSKNITRQAMEKVDCVFFFIHLMINIAIDFPGGAYLKRKYE